MRSARPVPGDRTLGDDRAEAAVAVARPWRHRAASAGTGPHPGRTLGSRRRPDHYFAGAPGRTCNGAEATFPEVSPVTMIW